jgi:hypothetical protein
MHGRKRGLENSKAPVAVELKPDELETDHQRLAG